MAELWSGGSEGKTCHGTHRGKGRISVLMIPHIMYIALSVIRMCMTHWCNDNGKGKQKH